MFRTFGSALLLAMAAAPAAAEAPLLPAEVARLAHELDAGIAEQQARADALAERAVADGELPDPRLKVGVANLPVDSFDRSAEAMTQLQVGLSQALPPGHTLRLRREATEALSAAERARAADRALAVRRDAVIAWLEAWQGAAERAVLRRSREVFERLVTITERHYAAGRNVQHDVLRARLERSRLDDRLVEAARREATARARLARYIDAGPAARPLPEALPALPPLAALEELLAGIAHHPRIAAADALVTVGDKLVAQAEEQYKPGFTLEATYGLRNGRLADRSSRPDMLSAMVRMDLPLFRGRRQDRRLAAARGQRSAQRYAREDRLREIESALRSEYAEWRDLGRRERVLSAETLVEAQRNAASALTAYQSDVTDFTTLMRAQLTELETELALLAVRVRRAQSHARLLYLSGGDS